MSSADAPPPVPPPYLEGVAVTRVSLVVNVALAVAKTSVGYAAHSQALIADGVHSLVDLTSDVAGLVGFKLAAKPGDADHPYGHHRYVSLACLFIAGMVLVFCVLLIWTSARALMQSASVLPGWPALVVAVIALAVKETLYRYVSWKARVLKSRVLAAGALDHRADALASLLVVVAIAVVHIGGPSWAFLDKAVGLALGGYLAAQGGKIFKQACADLLDTAPENWIIDDLREHILAVPGALAYHDFRARRVGDVYEVDLHLQVNPKLTVEAGHEIARAVKLAILKRHTDVFEVLIHLEPASQQHIKDAGVHDRKLGETQAAGAPEQPVD
jgi:cation diffusion facilitator family transporter